MRQRRLANALRRRRAPVPAGRLLADRRGTAAVDFALIVPVLVLILMAAVDVGRYALANLKMFNAAAALADIASRDATLTAATVDDLFSAAEIIAQPFGLGTDGRAILTGVSADAVDDPRIFWQVGGGGTFTATSGVGGTIGAPAALPPSLVLEPQETVIVAEVFFRYRSMFGVPFAERTVYQSAYFRPRLGSLRTLD